MLMWISISRACNHWPALACSFYVVATISMEAKWKKEKGNKKKKEKERKNEEKERNEKKLGYPWYSNPGPLGPKANAFLVEHYHLGPYPPPAELDVRDKKLTFFQNWWFKLARLTKQIRSPCFPACRTRGPALWSRSGGSSRWSWIQKHKLGVT